MKLKVKAVLDPKYQPIELAMRSFEAAVGAGGEELVAAVVRDDDFINTQRVRVFTPGTGHDEENYEYIERLCKSMLWVYGGYKIIIAGPREIYERIAADYSAGGARAFDFDFMGKVFERKFEVEYRPLADAPETKHASVSVGRHLNGCRIGFQLAQHMVDEPCLAVAARRDKRH